MIELISNFSKKEFLFHELLIKNQELVFNTDLNLLLSTTNTGSTIVQNNSSSEYLFIKKQFANRFLAFVQSYQMENATQDDSEYMVISIRGLLDNTYFNNMFNDFTNQNKIDNKEVLVKDVLCLLQDKNFCEIDTSSSNNKYENWNLSIKVRDKQIHKFIMNLLKSQIIINVLMLIYLINVEENLGIFIHLII